METGKSESPIAYKYGKASDVIILETLQLKITPPNEFNDPFEFTPRLICSDPRLYVEELLKDEDRIEFAYREALIHWRYGGTLSQFREHIKTHAEVERLVSIIPQIMPGVQKQTLNNISKENGVLCLSKRADSILMWGHYSDSHRGMAIGFDTASPVFRPGIGLRDVNYSKERVVFDANWKQGSLPFNQYEDKLILTKNDDWKYEEEQRQIFALSMVTKKTFGEGRIGYFVEFPAAAVKSIIFGVRCSDETKKKVQAIMSTGKFPNAKLLQADLHNDNFSLTLIPMPSSKAHP